MNPIPQPYVLPKEPIVPAEIRTQIADDYEHLARTGLPRPLEEYLADHYRIDITARYAGYSIRNPWGKASGQLSMTARQVEDDVAAGLGLVVLKTVIAEDGGGSQSMRAWAIRESRMLAEPIVGQNGEPGWTVSWKGRGWWQSFDEYLDLIRDARQIAGSQALVVPSCKFHLPGPEESAWRTGEYGFTVPRLREAWRSAGAGPGGPMPLEKDFSPTLAGSDRAEAREKVLEWLRTVPRLVREAALTADAGSDATNPSVLIGLKLFNALFNDDFQIEMLHAIHEAEGGRPDFYIYGNRLFDPGREFEGHRGIAYGGPDLSDRNLRVMSRFAGEARPSAGGLLEWSATGNISTGKIALEYALRGASSFQLHTFLQLPGDRYRMQPGNKVERALHELIFHPHTGMVVWMHHLASQLALGQRPIRFLDLVGRVGELRAGTQA